MRRRILALAAVNLAGSLAGIEILANAVYSLAKGELFYTSTFAEERPLASDLQAAEAVFHPYLGFINRVGRSAPGWGTNNHGFQVAATELLRDRAAYDYPSQRSSDEFVVGVFGGSVASGFAVEAQTSEVWRAAVGRIPAAQGRTVRVLNFAMAGYRQPQQLVALAYYLSIGQEFDVVLNIDGFNELVTSGANQGVGADPSFPADSLWGAWGRSLEAASGRVQDGPFWSSQYHRLESAAWRARARDCPLASCFLLARLMTRYHDRAGGQAASADVSESESASLFPTARKTTSAQVDVRAYAADLWLRSSLAMDQMLRARSTAYLQVIQPNQWFREAGEYEPIDRDHSYGWVSEPVNRGYPLLLERLSALASAGVGALDATRVFTGEPSRAIYLDDCCHYTPHGNELLFLAVAERLEALLRARPE
jgi:hypothetical protein